MEVVGVDNNPVSSTSPGRRRMAGVDVDLRWAICGLPSMAVRRRVCWFTSFGYFETTTTDGPREFHRVLRPGPAAHRDAAPRRFVRHFTTDPMQR